jgi:hypothetical protein
VAFLIGKDLHSGKTYFFDEEFAAALKATTVWPDYLKAIDKLEPFRDIARRWRTTETKNRQLFFHPADYPVRIWLSRSSRPASSGPKPTELAPSRTGSSP